MIVLLFWMRIYRNDYRLLQGLLWVEDKYGSPNDDYGYF